jgi:aryl-alcohol dehydrogenase-like predicted oxidoreductase
LANRDRIAIITKGGLSEKDPTTLAVEGLRAKVEKDITRSLECLRTDQIDLYFLHRDAPQIPVGEIMECLNAEKARGRIGAFGGSNWETSRVDEANEYADKHGMTRLAAVSNNLSLAVPTGPFYPGLVSTDDMAKRWHAKTGIPLFAWASLARGFFTGRFRPEIRDDPARMKDSFTANMMRIYCTADNLERLRRAEELAKAKGGFSAVQVALAWVLHQPFTALPLVGMHSNEEVASSLAALSIRLSEAEVATGLGDAMVAGTATLMDQALGRGMGEITSENGLAGLAKGAQELAASDLVGTLASATKFQATYGAEITKTTDAIKLAAGASADFNKMLKDMAEAMDIMTRSALSLAIEAEYTKPGGRTGIPRWFENTAEDVR